MKILVTDHISEEGLKPLREYAQVDIKTGLKPAEIIAIIGDYEALLVRSQTKVTAEIIEAGKKLQVIGRAGVGIDNIDVQAATRCGIIVVNAPTGNTISAAEHTIALMMALARYVPQANASLKNGQWRRNDFVGTEVRGKTLGIIGLGNVGSEVARRARGMEMKLLGFDPFVSAEYAAKLQVENVPLERILRESDFITLHIPLSAQTKGLIGEKELAMVKPNVRIINCARGGLIDEAPLVKAAKEKKIAGAAIDVFENEPTTSSPLFEVENIIVTPHLGASTAEAQVTAARDVADQLIDIIQGKPARYAVNAPFISSETMAVLMPFSKVARTLGRLASQLTEGQASTIQIKYQGEIADHDTNVLKAVVLGGLLEGIAEERVNLVNANLVAAKRGLKVVEQKEAGCQNYASMVTVEVTTSTGTTSVAGTVLNGESHVVKVNDYWLDIVPTGGYFLFCDHIDRPGLIGAVGKITGDADIDISAMYVGRLKPRGQALMVLALDEPLAEKDRKKVASLPDVHSAKLVKLD
ncbi:MAG: phosphoglycerate dehydrogenase [Dehalococcoidales bacterium]|nr:phosphoglycerate dehydrogenase [Dehalococcoidales bacterium]